MNTVETEMKALEGRTEGFKNGVKIGLQVGGKKKSEAAWYYKECQKRGHDWADGFEYGLLLSVRLLESLPQMKSR